MYKSSLGHIPKLVLLSLAVVCQLCSFSQSSSLLFERVKLREGQLESPVSSMLRDSRGFMWFGCDNGLYRYDGYKYLHFEKKSKDVNSISCDVVASIEEDKKGFIWLATFSGLNKFDRSNNRFTAYLPETELNAFHISNFFIEAQFDRRGKLWL